MRDWRWRTDAPPVGRVVDANESATATGRRAAGAEYLPGAGAFLRVGAGDPYRLQAFDLAAGGVEYMAGWARDKWPAADSAGLPVWGAVEHTVNNYSDAAGGQDVVRAPAVPAAPVVPAVPADVAAAFAEYFDGADGLARGGKSAAIRALVGDVPGGRAFQAAAADVDRLFGVWLADRTAAPILKMAAARG